MKMKSELKIPVFAESVEEDIVFGEPASIKDSIKRVLGNSVNFVDIDDSTLEQCVSAATNLLNHLNDLSKKSSNIKPESLTLQLGVSSTGKVAFWGSGMDIELATTIEITFKVT